MSYDFSFEKKQMFLLGTLAVLMSLLLVTAGFLIGRISITSPSTTATLALPMLPAKDKAVIAVPVVAAPAADAGTSPAAAAATTTAVVAAPAIAVSDTAPAAAAPALGAPRTYGDTASDSGYTLQYGAFRDPANAKDLIKQLEESKIPASSVSLRNSSGEIFSVVRSGTYPTVADAREAAVAQANKLHMPIVVRPAGRL